MSLVLPIYHTLGESALIHASYVSECQISETSTEM